MKKSSLEQESESLELAEAEGWTRAVEELRNFVVQDQTGKAEFENVEAALEGDPSFLGIAAMVTNSKILLKVQLSPVDMFFLSILLSTLEDGQVAQRVLDVLGKKRVGPPKKGAKSKYLALVSLEMVSEFGATNMESAWAMAAERCNVSDSRVKQAWTKWKDTILKEAAACGRDNDLKAMIEKNKVSQSSN